MLTNFFFNFHPKGGKEAEDDEPDKMAIAIGRFGRLKRWIIARIKGFFICTKNRIVRAIRGRNTEENDIALEVNDADLFPGQVRKLLSIHIPS